MANRKKLQEPAVQIQIGLVFLIIASVSTYFLQTRELIHGDWADALSGLLYGAAISFLLIGIWRRGKRNAH